MDETQVNRTEPNAGPRRSRTRRALTGAALVAAVTAGGLTVAAVNPLGIAGAQDNPGTTSGPSVAPSGSENGSGRHGRFAEHGSKVLDDSLAALVKDGTLTQAQADAVKSKVAETAKTVQSERKAQREERRQAMESTAATALGMSVSDLQAQLQSGRTLAQVAQEKGVDVGKVTAALVDAADKRIDQAVTDGKLDASGAATMKQRVAERITSMVTDGPHSRR